MKMKQLRKRKREKRESKQWSLLRLKQRKDLVTYER